MIRIHNSTDRQFYFTVEKDGEQIVESKKYKRRYDALEKAMTLYEVLKSLWDEKKGLEIIDSSLK